MANLYAPSGFQAGRPWDGRAPNFGAPAGVIAYNYASKIAEGDPVFQFTDGTIRLYVAGGTTIRGIFRGCKYYDPVTQRTQFYPQWPAPTTLPTNAYVEAYVDNDPLYTFRCQVQGGPVTQANVGQNIDIVAASSGAPNWAGRSVCGLNFGAIGNGATLPFRIVSVVGYPGNLLAGPSGPNALYDPTQANNWVEVTLNTSDITTRTGQA